MLEAQQKLEGNVLIPMPSPCAKQYRIYSTRKGQLFYLMPLGSTYSLYRMYQNCGSQDYSSYSSKHIYTRIITPSEIMQTY